ncbi:MAG: peptide chain release factor N(5)-glutamine methyltransferase [Candidatus Cloacimonadaceae bacterium]|jgi:release factor glutamine methyltransferase|nr:peptide chain release factor N(5)-glutamine methyltransferase [Candidatus Cloacimonadota bacterium]MDY0127712.1 peptide chain release factor N(5)-glutamine methyltransferase [Candidatus Cloacimonadaceae bacterium]MCB5254899.1 peptide chain release factor N(5)-glutamine methyltransferase [Candidatus Cloacimonadota bacterium]MCK9177759.1 peptide chain release factor N(5)-glutamine methyltransferase [Candidatus Cloacimonadota bacterium]MCK9242234.1 peptide chain release factor N(5)-glutamine me
MKTDEIFRAYPEVSRADLNYLLCEIFSCSPAELPQHQELPEDQLPLLHSWISRLKQDEPPQYILQKAWFYGLEFYVDARALIPRFDTEVLVSALLEKLRGDETVLEIGIGSAAISITLKTHFPLLKIQGTDIDPQALEVAAINVKRHQTQIELIQADLFPETILKYDLIVSNPPYIAAAEYQALESRVREHEPKLALLAEDDGLAVYKRIIAKASDYLKDSGLLAFEHGNTQQQALIGLTESAHYKTLQKGKDLAQRDRFLILQKQ